MFDDGPDKSYFLCLPRFFFLSHFFLFDLIELVTFDELDLFSHYSDTDGSGSVSPCTFAFPFSSGNSVGSSSQSVGSVSGVGFGGFFPTGIESLGDVVILVLFVLIGVESKGGQLIGVDSKGGRLI